MDELRNVHVEWGERTYGLTSASKIVPTNFPAVFIRKISAPQAVSRSIFAQNFSRCHQEASRAPKQFKSCQVKSEFSWCFAERPTGTLHKPEMRRIESWSSPHCWCFKGYLQLQDIPRLLMIGQSDLVQPELYKIQFQLVCIILRQATSSLILWQYMNGLWFLTFCISPSRAQPETNPSGMHNFMGEVTSVFFFLL